MIQSKKGVLSMPIKLMVSFMIIALMVPPIIGLVDSMKEDIDAESLSSIAEELRSDVSKVSGRSPEYKMTVEIDVAENCRLEVGGDDGYVIRLYSNENKVGTVILDVPICGPVQSIYGCSVLELSNSTDGVSVRVL